jgi:ribosomal protein S18 acetylase RimI-like enzyme
VLDGGDGAAIGYVLGALDTVAFEARCEEAWWPALRARHPIEPSGRRLDDLLIHLLHHRPTTDPAVLADHPSHLHIDLLPAAQSAGWGRQLLTTLCDSLRADGSPGVHWGVSTRNERAIGFYRHLGFEELASDAMILTFGQRLCTDMSG